MNKKLYTQNRTTNDPLQSSASTQSPIPSPINDEDDSTDSINLEQEQNSISLEAETQSTIIAGNEPTFSSEIAEASAT
ncbi:2674_t:CDS:2, partial [Entrophospora sp. SA101]